MVHSSFVRKQFLIYAKIILIAICIVYLLSIVGSYLPGSNRSSKAQKNQKRRRKALMLPPTSQASKVYLGAKQETSLLGRWTELAQNILGNIQSNSRSNLELRGSLNVHRWYSICGNTVDNLRRHILFPKHPKLRTSITRLGMQSKLRDFGQRIFGYIHPPLSGTYQFSVSSDDFSEVWLSSDSTPNNTNLICQVGGLYRGTYVMGFTRQREFNKYDSQTSQNIYLDGGE